MPKPKKVKVLNRAERYYVINHYMAGRSPEVIANEIEVPLKLVQEEVLGLQRPESVVPEPLPIGGEVIKGAFGRHKGSVQMTENASSLIDENVKLGTYQKPREVDRSMIHLIDPAAGY